MATDRRARQLERERLLRQARRRTAAAERQRRLALISGVVVVLIVVGVVVGLLVANSGSSKKTPAAAAPSAAPTTGSTTASTTCAYTADTASSSGGKNPGLPPSTPATGTHTATLVLAQGSYTGTVQIALSAKTPCTVNSFQWLTSKKFFDGTICHRETASSSLSVLQCGDPTGTGSGGPGYTIPDENLAGATYKAGTVAMANTGSAHTGGSQFFLVYKDSALPASYTPFGTITAGLDVLNHIAAVGQNDANGAGDGAPKTKVTITSFTIT